MFISWDVTAMLHAALFDCSVETLVEAEVPHNAFIAHN